VDGSGGWPAGAPYAAILVTAGAPALPPDLLNQLTDEGRLVIPEGPADHQSLKVYCRHGNSATSQKLCDCRFVKLIGRSGWPVEAVARGLDSVR
jgi:protein-L-isoaspartate(D-aspartate) O-methyltransferase